MCQVSLLRVQDISVKDIALCRQCNGNEDGKIILGKGQRILGESTQWSHKKL